MTAHKLVISPAAQSDLKEIYQYGHRNWDKSRAEGYLEDLKEQLRTLLDQPFISIDRSNLKNGLRSVPIKKHVLFYRVQTDTLEIVRLLHCRQDPQRNLS